MRILSACAVLIAALVAALAAYTGPASATANWDYTCSAGDAHVRIDVSLVFNQGTAGRISVSGADVAARPAGKDASEAVSFAADDIEQFWVADDAFRVSFSRYQGGDPEPTRLKIDTTCHGHTCKGTYTYARQGIPTSGSITCTAGAKG